MSEVLDRLEALFTLGGGVHATRPGLGPEEEQACVLAAGWMADAGLEVTWDAAGNVLGRAPGTEPGAPEVWTGSHLDTVPAGGRFDGALGVVAGIAAVAPFVAAPARRTVTVLALRDEEGWRFGRGLFGSRALCGTLEPGELDDRDAEGVTVSAALALLGRGAPPAAGWLDPAPAAFVELHIEQGPVLAEAGLPLGIVEAIVGMSGFEVVLTGTAGHAGTTPMAGRRDAMVAAARVVLALTHAASSIRGAVATVGQATVRPGASNVVPGRVVLAVDARAPDAERLDELEEAVHATAAEGAAAAGCDVQVTRRWRLAPAAMAVSVRDALRAAAADLGVAHGELPSGAGHDAQTFAAAGVPTGMLFARSLAGGISHNPAEHTDAEAAGAAVDVLHAGLRRLAEAG